MIGQSKLEDNKGLLPFDGYSMPLVCKGGLMYLKFQDIPKDMDLQTYPSVHLISPHEWDLTENAQSHFQRLIAWLL